MKRLKIKLKLKQNYNSLYTLLSGFSSEQIACDYGGEPLLPLRRTDGREPEHHDAAIQVQRQGA